MNFNTVQTILDENGQITGVIVPIELWREMRSEVETTYLLKSEVMRQRLIEAKNRCGGVDFEVVCEQLGIRSDSI
jgi:PHD/YefM family antitoxin component YafN of YafNO toxin-antitoxin module